MRNRLLLGVLAMALLVSCKSSSPAPDAASSPTSATPPAAATSPAAVPPALPPGPPVLPAELVALPDLPSRVARQLRVRLDFDEGLLPPAERAALKKLTEAALLMDELFLRQVDERNPALRLALAADPAQQDALRLFDMMAGPWDRLDGDKPFLGTRAKPKGAAFYPAGMTVEAFQAHLQANPGDKEAFSGYFSVIREEGGRLQAIPYSRYYGATLEKAAGLLEEAAAAASDGRLARYLRARAKAFRTDDYFESDMLWMDLGDGLLEVVIGPYEVYEDGLFGYKAAFESFLAIRDPQDSARLSSLIAAIPALDAKLPLPPPYKAEPRGMESPLSVVVLVFSAGDAKAGVQTLAFNLPNDEKVRQAKGSKKVMMRNVAEAKFNGILMPIARALMVPEQLPDVTFDAFFNHTLLHEIAHGLGPGILTLSDGTKSDVGRELKDLYSAIEETKADILGMWGSHQLVDRGDLPPEFAKQLYAAALAGLFRSMRFGMHEAHGRANLIQFNWLLKHGGIVRGADGRYRVEYGKIRTAVEDLARTLLVIEARGSYVEAKQLIDEYATIPPGLEEAFASLTGIPVDITPDYALLRKYQAW